MSINDDLKSLIGEFYYSDYIHQEHEHELAALLAEDYDELSREVEEQDAWRGSKEFNGILIKKAWCATRREDGMSERFTASSSIAHTGGR